MGGNFKFQVHDSDLEYFFWRFGDLKNESHFLKKATFSCRVYYNTQSIGNLAAKLRVIKLLHGSRKNS